MDSSSLSTSFMLQDSRSVAGASPRPRIISFKRIYSRERAPMRCMAVGDAERNQKSPKLEASNPKQAVSESSGKFSSLANSLLLNAASLINANRQTSHCVACQGSGIVECSACQGAGILAPEKVAKMNTMKHAVHKVTMLFSKQKSPTMYDSDWIKTNICRRCRGTGRVMCLVCNGTGRRIN